MVETETRRYREVDAGSLPLEDGDHMSRRGGLAPGHQRAGTGVINGLHSDDLSGVVSLRLSERG
jgi:hypothetical protein